MFKESNTQVALKNITYASMGYIWPMIFTLFVTPTIIFSIGIRDYGVYILIGSIVSLVGLIDLGIASAFQKYVTTYNAQKNTQELGNLIKSIRKIFICIGIVGFLIITSIGFIGCQSFNCDSTTSSQNYTILFILAGIIFMIEAFYAPFTVIPSALQRFDIQTKLNVVKLTLQQITILIVVLLGFSLLSILITTLLYTFIFAEITRRISNRLLKINLPNSIFSWIEIKKIYYFAIGTLINNAGTTSLVNIDRVLIPILLGPSQLTYYAVPGNIPARASGLIGTISAVLFPTSTKLHEEGNVRALQQMHTRSFRLLLVISAALHISIAALSFEILSYWLHDDFAQNSYIILMILTATSFLMSIHTYLSNILFGIHKIKVITATSVCMAIINIILLFILIPLFGITGAAWAYLIAVLPVVYPLYFLEYRYLHLTNRLYTYGILIIKIILVGSITTWITRSFLSHFIHNLLGVIIIGPSTVCIFILIYTLFGFFDKDDVQDIQKYIREVYKNITSKYIRARKEEI